MVSARPALKRASLFDTVYSPAMIGGAEVGSSLTLQSTSGNGSADFIKFAVGNNGATEAMRVLNSGNVGIGTTSPANPGGFDTILSIAKASGNPALTLQGT